MVIDCVVLLWIKLTNTRENMQSGGVMFRMGDATVCAYINGNDVLR